MARAKTENTYSLQVAGLLKVKETSLSKHNVRTPADVSSLCDDMRSMSQESFQVLTLNTKNGVIDRHLITLGLVDASLVHPREVFRVAIMDGAAAVILVHNHPSGDPSPSAEDIRITKQLVEAGKIIDVRVQDHVIVGRRPDESHCFVSLRETGLVDFS